MKLFTIKEIRETINKGQNETTRQNIIINELSTMIKEKGLFNIDFKQLKLILNNEANRIMKIK